MNLSGCIVFYDLQCITMNICLMLLLDISLVVTFIFTSSGAVLVFIVCGTGFAGHCFSGGASCTFIIMIGHNRQMICIVCWVMGVQVWCL